MALDTRSKRASSVGILLAFVLAPPLPDGTLGQGDRQHIAATYSGILATGVAINPFSKWPGATDALTLAYAVASDALPNVSGVETNATPNRVGAATDALPAAAPVSTEAV